MTHLVKECMFSLGCFFVGSTNGSQDTVDVLSNQAVLWILFNHPIPLHKVDSSGTPGRLDFLLKANSSDLRINISTMCVGGGASQKLCVCQSV